MSTTINYEARGLLIFFTGLVMLLITFCMTFLFLQSEIKLISVFGFIVPLHYGLSIMLDAAFRLFYLSLLGWISSVVIVKGLHLVWYSKFGNYQSIDSKD
jgi:hypothetical protein